jgi:hypothetical protein
MATEDKPADKAKQAEPAKVKVKITSENGHRHAGEKYSKDKIISVSEADAKLIVETFKVGERVEGK